MITLLLIFLVVILLIFVNDLANFLVIGFPVFKIDKIHLRKELNTGRLNYFNSKIISTKKGYFSKLSDKGYFGKYYYYKADGKPKSIFIPIWNPLHKEIEKKYMKLKNGS